MFYAPPHPGPLPRFTAERENYFWGRFPGVALPSSRCYDAASATPGYYLSPRWGFGLARVRTGIIQMG